MPPRPARTSLAEADWTPQDHDDMSLAAADAIAVLRLAKRHGHLDYALFVDGRPVGVRAAEACRSHNDKHGGLS